MRFHSLTVNGEVTIPGTVWLRTAEGIEGPNHSADLIDAPLLRPKTEIERAGSKSRPIGKRSSLRDS